VTATMEKAEFNLGSEAAEVPAITGPRLVA
jgi:hypothetical protein